MNSECESSRNLLLPPQEEMLKIGPLFCELWVWCQNTFTRFPTSLRALFTAVIRSIKRREQFLVTVLPAADQISRAVRVSIAVTLALAAGEGRGAAGVATSTTWRRSERVIIIRSRKHLLLGSSRPFPQSWGTSGCHSCPGRRSVLEDSPWRSRSHPLQDRKGRRRSSRSHHPGILGEHSYFHDIKSD